MIRGCQYLLLKQKWICIESLFFVSRNVHEAVRREQTATGNGNTLPMSPSRTVFSGSGCHTNGDVNRIAEAAVTGNKGTPVKTKNRKAVKNNSVAQFPLVCNFRKKGCKNRFESSDALEHHCAMYHIKRFGRKFVCYLCPKTFEGRVHTQRHMDSVHFGIKRYKCPFPMCPRAFSLRGSLKVHVYVFHAERDPLNCSKCPMIFYHKHEWKRHMANEHGNGITYAYAKKRFKCCVCSRKFSYKFNLKRHMNTIHTHENTFRCPKCPYKSLCSGNLKAHYAMHCEM